MLSYPNGLYHRSVYLPDEIGLSIPQFVRQVTWSLHAQEKAKQANVKYLPRHFPYPQVIEVEVQDRKVIKAVYRHEFSQSYDITFPLILGLNFAKTVWFCRTNDEHETLYKERYVRG